MRVYVSVDMEGIAGIAHPHQVTYGRGAPDRVDYDRSRGLMAGEANAAVAGAFDAGAREVVVNDSHWQMRNLRAEELDPRARVLIGDKPYSMTQGIGDGEPFAAAAFVGYHAGAGHPRGIIAHTYSSQEVAAVRVNGVPHNEAGLNALRLGAHGVPVALVSGDDALAEEVAELLPWAERVVVKRALTGQTADSLAPAEAQRAVRDGMVRALGRVGELRPYRLETPLTLEVDLKLAVMADYAAVMPGVERRDASGVRVEAADAEELYRSFLAIVRLAGVPVTW